MKKMIIAGGILMVSLVSCTKSKKAETFAEEKITIKNKAVIAGVPAGAVWDFDSSRSDEFNGSSLDATKWSNAPLWYYGGLTGLFAFKTANAYVSGGYARLVAKKENHNNTTDPQFARGYTAGCLKSKFEVGENTYTEISAKMIQKEANVCAAIWLGDQPTTAKHPNIEIDLQESKDPIGTPGVHQWSLLDWPMNPYNPLDQNNTPGTWTYNNSTNLDDGFHTYGVERRAGRVRIFFDELLRLDTDAETFNAGAPFLPEYVTQLRPLILSIEGHAGQPVDAYLPSEFLIDWVHVFTVRQQ